MKDIEGFEAKLEDDDNLGLTLSDGVGESKLWLSALEMAEALARLEEHVKIDEYDFPTESQSLEPEVRSLDADLPGIARVAYPSAEDSYRAVQLELYEPRGQLLLRRISDDEGSSLEFTTPAGSAFVFGYDEVREYLRPILPR